jgi:hypothetical protein
VATVPSILFAPFSLFGRTLPLGSVMTVVFDMFQFNILLLLCYEDILAIDKEIDLEELIFDKWNARQLINNLDKQTYITCGEINANHNYKKVPSSAACSSDCILAL